jgi:hypothetical protein
MPVDVGIEQREDGVHVTEGERLIAAAYLGRRSPATSPAQYLARLGKPKCSGRDRFRPAQERIVISSRQVA